MYDKISAIIDVKGEYMRIKKVCFNCSNISYKDDTICSLCNNLFTNINTIDAIKISFMDEQQRVKWIERKTGHPMKKEEIAKRQKHVDRVIQEFEQQKQAEHKAAQQVALESALARANNTNAPKCPICGSTSINKITLTTRAVKTAAFGVVGAVDDAGKTYKCGKCGCKF